MIFWDHKEVFLHIGRGSRSWMTKRWRPHSSSSLQRNKTFFLSIKNCYLFLHRICWDQEEAKGTRSVEIRNWGRWRSRGCRGIFHSVLKIMIMGIWFTYNTIKLCKFLFLSFKTVVPPKSRGDFPNLEILHFFLDHPVCGSFKHLKHWEIKFSVLSQKLFSSLSVIITCGEDLSKQLPFSNVKRVCFNLGAYQSLQTSKTFHSL